MWNSGLLSSLYKVCLSQVFHDSNGKLTSGRLGEDPSSSREEQHTAAQSCPRLLSTPSIFGKGASGTWLTSLRQRAKHPQPASPVPFLWTRPWPVLQNHEAFILLLARKTYLMRSRMVSSNCQIDRLWNHPGGGSLTHLPVRDCLD